MSAFILIAALLFWIGFVGYLVYSAITFKEVCPICNMKQIKNHIRWHKKEGGQ